MIQRIQTIYLLIAASLTGSLLILPYAEIVNMNGEVYRFDSGGFYSIGNHDVIFGSFPIIFFCIVSVALILFNIFQYKNRTRQIKLSKVTILVLLALLLIISYDVWRCVNTIQGHHMLNIYLVFPMIAIIFLYFANNAIMKDIKLLKSVDRIR